MQRAYLEAPIVVVAPEGVYAKLGPCRGGVAGLGGFAFDGAEDPDSWGG